MLEVQKEVRFGDTDLSANAVNRQVAALDEPPCRLDRDGEPLRHAVDAQKVRDSERGSRHLASPGSWDAAGDVPDRKNSIADCWPSSRATASMAGWISGIAIDRVAHRSPSASRASGVRRLFSVGFRWSFICPSVFVTTAEAREILFDR
jgi:hypothetical protein